MVKINNMLYFHPATDFKELWDMALYLILSTLKRMKSKTWNRCTVVKWLVLENKENSWRCFSHFWKVPVLSQGNFKSFFRNTLFIIKQFSSSLSLVSWSHSKKDQHLTLQIYGKLNFRFFSLPYPIMKKWWAWISLGPSFLWN